jgi:hypothetical protein
LEPLHSLKLLLLLLLVLWCQRNRCFQVQMLVLVLLQAAD